MYASFRGSQREHEAWKDRAHPASRLPTGAFHLLRPESLGKVGNSYLYQWQRLLSEAPTKAQNNDTLSQEPFLATNWVPISGFLGDMP